MRFKIVLLSFTATALAQGYLGDEGLYRRESDGLGTRDYFHTGLDNHEDLVARRGVRTWWAKTKGKNEAKKEAAKQQEEKKLGVAPQGGGGAASQGGGGAASQGGGIPSTGGDMGAAGPMMRRDVDDFYEEYLAVRDLDDFEDYEYAW